MKRIYLIDCPGVVYNPAESDEEKVLKGVVRVELVENPGDYIPAVLAKVKRDYLARTYRIASTFGDHNDFLEKVAQKYGKLLKGGEPDINTVAKMVLNDWQRGKIPFFVPPPGCEMPPKNEALENEEIKKDQDFKQIKVVHQYDPEDMQDDSVNKDNSSQVATKQEPKEEVDGSKEAIDESQENEVKAEEVNSKKRKTDESPKNPTKRQKIASKVKTSSGVFIVTDNK